MGHQWVPPFLFLFIKVQPQFFRLKNLGTGIERYYGLTKEIRYHMENNTTYMVRGNILIHVIEHDIVATLDILYEHKKLENRATYSTSNIEQAQFQPSCFSSYQKQFPISYCLRYSRKCSIITSMVLRMFSRTGLIEAMAWSTLSVVLNMERSLELDIHNCS